MAEMLYPDFFKFFKTFSADALSMIVDVPFMRKETCR